MFTIFCKKPRFYNYFFDEACLRTANQIMKRLVDNHAEKMNNKYNKFNIQIPAIMDSTDNNNNNNIPKILSFFGIISAVYFFTHFLQYKKNKIE